MTETPDPYKALERVLALKPQQRRHLLRLEVWCEANKCTPVRVFTLREGQLAQCRSDADVRDLRERYPHLSDWSRRRAFFLEWWLTPEHSPMSRLQVVCNCAQTRTRLVDVQKLADLIPPAGTATRRVRLTEIVASDL